MRDKLSATNTNRRPRLEKHLLDTMPSKRTVTLQLTRQAYIQAKSLTFQYDLTFSEIVAAFMCLLGKGDRTTAKYVQRVYEMKLSGELQPLITGTNSKKHGDFIYDELEKVQREIFPQTKTASENDYFDDDDEDEEQQKNEKVEAPEWDPYAEIGKGEEEF